MLQFSQSFRRNFLVRGRKAHQHAIAATSSEHATANGSVKMMIMLRHADSERSQARDHDRPLSAAGRQQALDIARQLQAHGVSPDLVLASNAKRTKQTLDEMSAVMSQLADLDTHFYGSLYTVAALDGQTRAHLQECLLEVVDDAKHSCVLLVGHNKGWEEAASSFASTPVKLKPASAALLKASAHSWAEVLAEDAEWELVSVLSPKKQE